MSYVEGVALVQGEASGPLLFSTVPLSLWGGTNASTGEVIDRHHPLSGKCLQGRILAMPSGRGSCTGSMAILELLNAGTAPAGLIFEVPEHIITLGVIVAQKLLRRHIPVVLLPRRAFASLRTYEHITITGTDVDVGSIPGLLCVRTRPQDIKSSPSKLQLDEHDSALLAKGPANAKGFAMNILIEFAALQGATSLIGVSQAHIDACVYTGPASLLFAESLLALPDAKVAVPTSMNSLSIDQRRWREIGMDEDRAEAANRLGNAYVKMGARPTFTCAPYLLDSAPSKGQHIGWAESNAVVFANSVLGARTQKYPDLMDVCIALTGRAPFSGCHESQNRAPQLVVGAPKFSSHDESIYPLLGYCVGQIRDGRIPVVVRMEDMHPSISDLKAFSAAFATTSSSAMFHIRGITPEALSIEQKHLDLDKTIIGSPELARCWQDLNTAEDESVSLVALGNPHFSLEEFHSLVENCQAYSGDVAIPLVVTTSREIYSKFQKSDRAKTLDKAGVQVISDTCWCMLEEPVIPAEGNIMTNSAKYAHYAPGLVRRKVHFDSLEHCVRAAFQGRHSLSIPGWLKGDNVHGR